jgi:precorrin-4 C11-methyltransferase
MKIALWSITKHGMDIGAQLKRAFPEATWFVPRKFEDAAQGRARVYEKLLSRVIAEEFHRHETHVFVISLGAVLRMIAPLLKDKKQDPAVVVVDDRAQYAISALSGHVGRANEFTEKVAAILDARSVVSTASDVGQTLPVDILGRDFGWTLENEAAVTAVSASVVNEEKLAFIQECGERNWWAHDRTLPDHIHLFDAWEEWETREDRDSFKAVLWVSDRVLPEARWHPFRERLVIYRPRSLVVGTGCNRDTPYEEIRSGIESTLQAAGLSPLSVRAFASIDRKKDEKAYQRLEREWRRPFLFYPKEALAAAPIARPSKTVEKHVGTPGVAEPAALLASGASGLLSEKIKFANMTTALARCPFPGALLPKARETEFSIKPGRVYIVGAGPGSSDLLTLRAAALLGRADLVLFTGSLVPRRVLEHCPRHCEKIDSKGLDLESITRLLVGAARNNKVVLRLHTGEPSIFGATLEQCDIFRQAGVPFEIVPGISSFQAAAARLKAEFTIPEVSQTLIISRAAGRTPVPAAEELKELGRHASTLVLYLSAGLGEKVQRDLLENYAPQTPAAICYRVSWPDEKIIRCELRELAASLERHGIDKHALIIVGPGLKSHGTKSRLYAADFSHRFRRAASPKTGKDG